MEFVDFEVARQRRGLRIVIAGQVPSPWSQGAMGVFDAKGIDYVAVRLRPVAEQVRQWTGAHNAPVVVHDDEPPRTGWAEILALGERLGGSRALVPAGDDERVRMHGLAHDVLGEGGLAWSGRLLMVHASFASDGRDGWPTKIAQYLAPKYGYAADRVDAARARAIRVMKLLERTLAERDYYFGSEPSALDVYSATTLNVLSPLPHEKCPMPEPVRHAFETLDADVRDAVPASLVRHRDRMYERHLPLPMRF